MKYFNLNLTPEQANSEFRRLSMQFHPDVCNKSSNGANCNDDFVEMKKEYDDYKVIQEHLPEIRKAFAFPTPEAPKTVYVPVYTPSHTDTPLKKKMPDIEAILTKSSEIFKDGVKIFKDAKIIVKEVKKKKK